MRLRKPCEHDQYDEHLVAGLNPPMFTCPGGQFLPEDALVIEKVDGEWPTTLDEIVDEWATDYVMDDIGGVPRLGIKDLFDALAASQVGKPG